MQFPYTIYSLGNTAATIDLGNQINEQLNNKVLSMHQWFKRYPFDGIKDIIIAYSSLTIVYDPMIIKQKNIISKTVYHWIEKKLQESWEKTPEEYPQENMLIRVPVCYHSEFGPDLEFFAREKKLTPIEIIHLHSSKIYRVYMLGFLPGFSYLGEVDEQLIIPRKQIPISVEPGSIGIAGNQTGIYPLKCPGGWQIIGRTPMKFFDATIDPPVKLQPGNYVQFYEISREEFLVASN